MRIEIISDFPNSRQGMIYIDDEPWQVVHKSFYRKKLKFAQRANSRDEAIEQLKKIAFESALNYILKLLGARPYSEKELSTRLQAKHIDNQQVEEILSKCRNWGYIDDKRELEKFCNAEIRKGKGPLLIQQKAQVRFGLKPQNNFYPLDDQIDRIRTLGDTKPKEQRIRFLLRRGFSMETILMLFTHN